MKQVIWLTSSETHHTPPMLSVGCIVTLILEYCNIKLGNPIEVSSQIDACYLSNIRYTKATVLLSNIRDTIIFETLIKLLYKQSMELPLKSFKLKRRRNIREVKANENCPPPSHIMRC